ncbi:MAG: glycosyltransferase family 4 protein [Planctomycetota bacterium]
MNSPGAPAAHDPALVAPPGARPLRLVLVNRHVEDMLGGSELQCDQIAAELVRRGHALTYAVRLARRAAYERPYACAPLRDLAEFERLLERCRPDVVYWRFNRAGLRGALRATQRHGALFVLALSHDDDTRVLPRSSDLWPPQRALRALQAGWNALARARIDGFVAQHEGQARGLPPERTRVIHNSAFVAAQPFHWPRPYVAWVANLKARKRPERFVALARACAASGLDFLAVGALQDRRYAWLGERARVPSQAHWLGALPPAETNGVIAGAEALVLTCEPEGFPNVLLQAWSLARPTLALAYDPDGLIARHRLGALAASESELARELLRLWAAPDERAACGARARALVEREFSLPANVTALESFLRELLERGRR